MINKIYNDKKLMEEMQKHFQNHGHLQLLNFINKPNEFKLELKKQKYDEIYLPETESKHNLNLKNIYNHDLIKYIEYFKSKDFIEYIEDVLDYDLELKSFTINKYSHKDYVILNDNNKNSETIDIIFDLSDEWKIDFGGKLVYTTRFDELIYIEPVFNSLTIVYKADDVMKYLKYINNKAKKKNIYRIEIELNIIEN